MTKECTWGRDWLAKREGLVEARRVDFVADGGHVKWEKSAVEEGDKYESIGLSTVEHKSVR